MSERGIFISYRRADSRIEAGRLSDDLKRAFGDSVVFRDSEDIRPGEDFVHVLDAVLAECRVLLAMVGPTWLDQLNRRSESAGDAIDHVRREIECALSRSVEVIPVLVRGAAMPEAQSLPESLRAFARRQAHRQNDDGWRRDTLQLLGQLETLTGRSARDPFRLTPRLSTRLRAIFAAVSSPRGLAVAATVVLVGGIAAGVGRRVVQSEQESADVAFVLPPHGHRADPQDELRVFNDLRSVLKRSLDLPNVEVVPDRVVGSELERFKLENKDELLGYKGELGFARVFIESSYSLDVPTGKRRVLVTPYLRPVDRRQAWRVVEGWPGRAYDGDASWRIALRIGFELIEFLAAKDVLRLQDAEKQQSREKILIELRTLFETHQSPCEAEQAVLVKLRDPNKLAAMTESTAEVRRALEVGCARPGDEGAERDRSAETAAAVYGRVLGL